MKLPFINFIGRENYYIVPIITQYNPARARIYITYTKSRQRLAIKPRRASTANLPSNSSANRLNHLRNGEKSSDPKTLGTKIGRKRNNLEGVQHTYIYIYIQAADNLILLSRLYLQPSLRAHVRTIVGSRPRRLYI